MYINFLLKKKCKDKITKTAEPHWLIHSLSHKTFHKTSVALFHFFNSQLALFPHPTHPPLSLLTSQPPNLNNPIRTNYQMYPSSTSSSSQGSMSHTSTTAGGAGGGLTRYGSAPGSFLTTAVEAVVNGNHEFASHGSHHSHLGPSRFFQSNLASTSLNSESTSKAKEQSNLQRSIGFNDLTIGGGSGAGGGVLPTTSTTPLVRHSSSPARFLNQLATAAGDTGKFSTSLFFLIDMSNDEFNLPVYDSFLFAFFFFLLKSSAFGNFFNQSE